MKSILLLAAVGSASLLSGDRAIVVPEYVQPIFLDINGKKNMRIVSDFPSTFIAAATIYNNLTHRFRPEHVVVQQHLPSAPIVYGLHETLGLIVLTSLEAHSGNLSTKDLANPEDGAPDGLDVTMLAGVAELNAIDGFHVKYYWSARRKCVAPQ